MPLRPGVHKESGFILAIKDIENIDDDEDLKKEIDILKVIVFSWHILFLFCFVLS